MGLVCAQAAQYAARNRAQLESCTREDYDVLVKVKGSDKLNNVGGTDAVDGHSAEAKARATPWSFGSGGFGAGGGVLPVGGGGGGSLMGADPRLQVYADAAAKFGLTVTSGRRPGDSGSYHGSGNAIDVAAPMTPEGKAAMLKFANYAIEHWGSQLEELIHTPLGYGIKNGVKVSLQVYAAVNAEHYNHVHIADTEPAKPGEDSGPPKAGGGIGSDIGSSPGLGGVGGTLMAGGGFGLKVHLVRYDGQGGRSGDISGVPGNIPGSVRQVMFNIMICESSGNPHAIEAPGGNGGALGHYGLFQFDIPTWQSVGGSGSPLDAPPEEQWKRALILYQQRGLQPWDALGSWATSDPPRGRREPGRRPRDGGRGVRRRPGRQGRRRVRRPEARGPDDDHRCPPRRRSPISPATGARASTSPPSTSRRCARSPSWCPTASSAARPSPASRSPASRSPPITWARSAPRSIPRRPAAWAA